MCFASFTKMTSMKDVVRKCGIPDEHHGSGIYIFLYDMNDGSVVVVGTADLNQLIYVNHIADSRSRSLLRGVSENASTRSDFSITLKRIGCLGSCPDYTVTILGNGGVCDMKGGSTWPPKAFASAQFPYRMFTS